jgi:hypothetical protein
MGLTVLDHTPLRGHLRFFKPNSNLRPAVAFVEV